MIQEWLEKGIFLYVMVGICAIAIVLKMLLIHSYNRMMKKTAEWTQEPKGWFAGIRNEYAACLENRGELFDVDIFVDKWVGNKKLLGIMLSTWDKLSGQTWLICLGITMVAVFGGIFYNVDNGLLLFTFLLCMWMVILNLIVDNLANLRERREQLGRNLKNYFKNLAPDEPMKKSREEITQEEMDALKDICRSEHVREQKGKEIDFCEKTAVKEKKRNGKRRNEELSAENRRERMKQQLVQEKREKEEMNMEMKDSSQEQERVEENQEQKKRSLEEAAAFLAQEISRDQMNHHLIEEVLKEFLV